MPSVSVRPTFWCLGALTASWLQGLVASAPGASVPEASVPAGGRVACGCMVYGHPFATRPEALSSPFTITHNISAALRFRGIKSSPFTITHKIERCTAIQGHQVFPFHNHSQH